MDKSHQAENPAFPLAVDASSTRIQVGIPGDMDWVHLETVELPAMEGLFQTLSRLMEKTGVKLRQVDELFFAKVPAPRLGCALPRPLPSRSCGMAGERFSLFLQRPGPGIPDDRATAPAFASALPERLALRPNSVGKQRHRKKNLHESKEALSLFPESHHLPDPRSIGESIQADKTIEYDLARAKGLKDLRSVAEPAGVPVVYSPVPPTFKKWEPARSRQAQNEVFPRSRHERNALLGRN